MITYTNIKELWLTKGTYIYIHYTIMLSLAYNDDQASKNRNTVKDYDIINPYTIISKYLLET